ncbi:MAG TPA: ATP phosphoribosyltransferase, partial [Candidatus Norongarragalinales archaeon]|nr:ATP phosphoribosyltransferase [Candidatus Norongarragalinales archaeon]
MPNKGALAKPAQALVRCAGFEFNGNDRQYSSGTSANGYRFLLARARDIPAYVASGVADLGITGRDVTAELGARVLELAAFPFGFCRLVYATPKGRTLLPKRVATGFPNLASRFLASQSLDAQIVRLDGAIEASVNAGMADAVIDLSVTGKTLYANGLEEKAEVMRSSAVLIANPETMKMNQVSVEAFLGKLLGELTLLKIDLMSMTLSERCKLVERNRTDTQGIQQTVREIFSNVQKDRDSALSFYSEKFDRVKLSPRQFEVTSDEIKDAYSQVSEDVVAALKKTAENIRCFAQKELPTRFEIKMESGFAGKRIVPLDSVGVYAPGGSAAYP